ncbi:hypothetical protein M569_13853, partial [Genlisea aurea]
LMERESSDEDADQENLISQNARSDDAVKSSNHSHHRSSLHVERDLRRRFSAAAGGYKKRYFLAIVLPALILVLYFTTDLKNVFAMSIPKIGYHGGDALSDRMRESELQALNLLRQQEAELFKLWNYTSSANKLNYSHDPVNVNSSAIHNLDLFLDLKSQVFSQLSLNKRIQTLLLSSHGNGEAFHDSNYSFTDDGLTTRCPTANRNLLGRRKMEWDPLPNKFLLAICISGQMSNHLICLEKHMFFAALLKRILVIPSSKVDYAFHRVLDIDHINTCLGKKAVVTFEEFSVMQKNHLHIDRFLCYFSSPQPCYMDDEYVKKLKGVGLSLSKVESVWKEDVKSPRKTKVEDVVSKFSSNEAVVAVGDLFFAQVEEDWVMQPGGPIEHKCKTLIEPSRLIRLTAQRFVQTFLGKDFIALHFRRHGFLKFCNAKQPSCFYPVPQAAECINRVIERANAPVIYLSTDAAESETGLLQSLVTRYGNTVPLVKRPARNSAEKWDALLYRHGLEGDSQVEAMLDKAICALSSVFIGSSGSTFTEDILRLRRVWESESVCDEYLCEGRLPNYIAEDE